ncbi:U1 small nuclear ribonucleoprotein A [Cryptosporidium canis]|uniref:U1 small nuclear ribonucleoprotein A n=1 Tax=Cryptosporidium canis TaxID=195482 RepID=A0A9D5HYC6_9CRYT|nr:U1 small nuclear ribonucleoprotein A [Cryptosporidium canis]
MLRKLISGDEGQPASKTLYCKNLNDKINKKELKVLLFELFIQFGRPGVHPVSRPEQCSQREEQHQWHECTGEADSHRVRKNRLNSQSQPGGEGQIRIHNRAQGP